MWSCAAYEAWYRLVPSSAGWVCTNSPSTGDFCPGRPPSPDTMAQHSVRLPASVQHLTARIILSISAQAQGRDKCLFSGTWNGVHSNHSWTEQMLTPGPDAAIVPRRMDCSESLSLRNVEAESWVDSGSHLPNVPEGENSICTGEAMG